MVSAFDPDGGRFYLTLRLGPTGHVPFGPDGQNGTCPAGKVREGLLSTVPRFRYWRLAER